MSGFISLVSHTKLFLRYTKFDRRGTLSQEKLEAILRIMINGPSVEQFDSLKYAKEWISKSHLATDEGRSAGGISNQRPPSFMASSEDDDPEKDFEKFRLTKPPPFL